MALKTNQEYLLNQLNTQLNETYLNKFNEFLISYDNLWSNIYLLRLIDSNINFNQTYYNTTQQIQEAIQ